jgi:hypothetical protein
MSETTNKHLEEAGALRAAICDAADRSDVRGAPLETVLGLARGMCLVPREQRDGSPAWGILGEIAAAMDMPDASANDLLTRVKAVFAPADVDLDVERIACAAVEMLDPPWGRYPDEGREKVQAHFRPLVERCARLRQEVERLQGRERLSEMRKEVLDMTAKALHFPDASDGGPLADHAARVWREGEEARAEVARLTAPVDVDAEVEREAEAARDRFVGPDNDMVKSWADSSNQDEWRAVVRPLVERCARLQREVGRLSGELREEHARADRVERKLRAEIARLKSAPGEHGPMSRTPQPLTAERAREVLNLLEACMGEPPATDDRTMVARAMRINQRMTAAMRLLRAAAGEMGRPKLYAEPTAAAIDAERERLLTAFGAAQRGVEPGIRATAAGWRAVASEGKSAAFVVTFRDGTASVSPGGRVVLSRVDGPQPR